MNKDKIRNLFYKYFDDLTTEEENCELARLLQQEDLKSDVKLLMEEAWGTFHAGENIFDPDLSKRMLQRILEKTPVEAGLPVLGNRTLFRKVAAAAAVLALCIGSAVYYNHSHQRAAVTTVRTANNIVHDVLPGTNKAFLTLADGRDILLDQASPGLLTTEGNTRIIKEEGDRLSYEVASGSGTQKAAYNTLRTPRGGQYHLVLPDGTKVWLNAASSIMYPVEFSDNVRTVRIEGEVFFEVTPLRRQKGKIPFIVTTGNVSIEVLGTQFNINAYRDEKDIKTTLLKGSVKVSTLKSSSLLNPGHEASVTASSTDINISKANTDQAIAWKNGYFQFQEARLQDIMRQLSKWYDLDVRYNGKLPVKKFTGEIPRSATLLQVLEILEINQVQVRIIGKEIHIGA